MKIKSLTNKELEDEIMWRSIDARVRKIEPRYEGQPEEERRKEYEALHAIYRKYYDEAHRRGMVPFSSTELETKKV